MCFGYESWPENRIADSVCLVAGTSLFDYTFSENGLLAMKGDEVIAQQSFKAHLGEENLKTLINFMLHYIADLDIPIKRGTFIEFRNGMLNVSPIGRNCSQEERDEFEKFDEKAGVRCRNPRGAFRWGGQSLQLP